MKGTAKVNEFKWTEEKVKRFWDIEALTPERYFTAQAGAELVRHLSRHLVGRKRILDYGCGSGILAIAAALYGTQSVDAVDIDEAAIASTLLNAKANGVTLQAGLSERAVGAYDTVLANILATPLKVLAPLLCSHVKPTGHLVLAGILERQAQELQLAYAPYCNLQVSDQEDGWILMTATL